MKISQGRVRDKHVIWFPQLIDKNIILCVKFMPVLGASVGKSVKTHLYWSMKNCQGKGETLKSLIDNIPSHYQVNYLVIVSNKPLSGEAEKETKRALLEIEQCIHV